MATAEQILTIADDEVGYKEQPANSNLTKYGKWYGMDGEPWCAIFVSWVFDQAGALDLIGGKQSYTPYFAQWFRQQHRWIERTVQPQEGDVVFFHNGVRICHVGIVRGWSNGCVLTIEGNTAAGNDANGGQVQKRTRPLGSVGGNWYVAGYGRPDYTEERGGEMQLTDIVTRPDGHRASVADMMAYMDMRLEKMEKEVAELRKQARTTNRKLTNANAKLKKLIEPEEL